METSSKLVPKLGQIWDTGYHYSSALQMFDPQIAGCESDNNNAFNMPLMSQTCLATNQIVAGSEKLLQKLVSSSTALCTLKKLDLLQDRFDSWMVRRAK